jgi:hypothetical protein
MGSLWNFSSTNHEHDLTTLDIHMVVIPIFGMTHLIAIIVFVSKLVRAIIVFRHVGPKLVNDYYSSLKCFK